MPPPVTRRAFGLEVAYQMCDKIKVTAGCGICDEDGIAAEELEWYDMKEGELSNDDDFILEPYCSVLNRYAVVCLDCVQQLRDVRIPNLLEEANGDKSSK